MIEIPRKLREVEFVVAHFQLEFQDSYRMTAEVALRLRRDLHQVARHALAIRDFAALFDPPLSSDPVALRRHQRPGPPFVLLPSGGEPGLFEPGDQFDLTVVFWGDGVRRLGDFAMVLKCLGPLGLHRGEGPFELVSIEAEDPAGVRLPVWRGGDLSRLAPPISDACWWLETCPPAGTSLCLEFFTPARLVSRGKPLFRTSFARLFPFVLRRVTSMLHAHCDVDVVADAAPLLAAAANAVEIENRLAWEDWRVLGGTGRSQDLGGLGGAVCLEGDSLAEISWVLHLGSLMNVGKGAAFGAGRYGLRSG